MDWRFFPRSLCWRLAQKRLDACAVAGGDGQHAVGASVDGQLQRAHLLRAPRAGCEKCLFVGRFPGGERGRGTYGRRPAAAAAAEVAGAAKTTAAEATRNSVSYFASRSVFSGGGGAGPRGFPVAVHIIGQHYQLALHGASHSGGGSTVLAVVVLVCGHSCNGVGHY
jgi:hypothetical protein